MLIHEGPDPKDEDQDADEREVAEVEEEPDPDPTEEAEPEPGEEDEPELEAEPEPQPPKGKSRDENMAALRAQARRAAELEQENARLRQGAQPQQNGEDPQARQRRLAAMTPEQRRVYEDAEREERITRMGSLAEFRVAEMTDKAAFQMMTRSDPRASKYAPEVEARLNQMRAQGMNASREDVLRYIIGERVMANGPKAKKQIANAKAEVDRQTTKPEKPKGDRGGKRPMDEKAARKARLLGQTL